ncbi:hypothetical protein [Amaricoccus solimangrovi]|uniref:Uncharacterized protein n=1 Tax=Amaricoccus solimangrovi TaxID=2589815 RepID=A0A501WUY2_9RHOB|nr:hypothetical protein [Amaricoccus solimangrovi]TPE53218.1 hypothetical protein FJM51_04150 [Amaricoccus solimangrovi]
MEIDDLALDRAIEQIEDFDLPGATEAEWRAEATRRMNTHLTQERAIIALGLDKTLDAEALDAWRVLSLPAFIDLFVAK